MFRITSPLIALRLYSWQDRHSTSLICSLPEEALVEVEAASSIAEGMVEICWEGKRYAVFDQDLKAKSRVDGG